MNALKTENSTALAEVGDLLRDLRQDRRTIELSLKDINERLDQMEEEQPIHPTIARFIEKKRRQRVTGLLGGKASPAYQDRGLRGRTFQQAGRDFKECFRVERYDLVRRADQNRAIDFWNYWLPHDEVNQRIQEINREACHG